MSFSQMTYESQRWDSNPLRPPYESGARPVEHHWHCCERHFKQANRISRLFSGRLLTAR